MKQENQSFIFRAQPQYIMLGIIRQTDSDVVYNLRQGDLENQ